MFNLNFTICHIDTPDESPYEKDDLIYNHSGSFDYGDVYLLEDIKSITPSKIQGRIANWNPAHGTGSN